MDHVVNNLFFLLKNFWACLLRITYYKTILPLKVLSTNFEVSIRDKKSQFIHLYRTPSQSQDEFHDFLRNLEMNLDDSLNINLFVTTVIGDFNAKSNK